MPPYAERDISMQITSSNLYPPELPLQPDLPPAQDTLDQKFAAFHSARPEVFEAIYARAYRLAFIQHKKRLSMKRIFEDLRDLMECLGDEYGLNNSFTSRYTDLLIEEHPEFATLFHRRARAKGKMKRVYVKAL